jgi:hypothetical protein
LAVLTSIVFRVSEVEVYWNNYTDTGLVSTTRVRDAADIHGNSIFRLRDAEIIRSIETEVPDVKVINIERKFPNRVVINAVKMIPLAYLSLTDTAGGGPSRHLILNSELKITEVTLTEPLDLIRISLPNDDYFLSSDLTAGEGAGDYIRTSSGRFENTLREVFYAFERVDFREFDVIALLDAIIFFDERLIIRTAAGVRFELSGTNRTPLSAARIPEKVRWAVSVYTSHPEWRERGLVRVFENASGNVTATYSETG